MILWFVASAIATAAAFLVAPDRRGPAALAVRGLAVALGTLILVVLPFGVALSARWGGSQLTAESHAVALATARALLTENAALILLGNLFGIALAAWLRIYDRIETPTEKLLTERLTLILAGLVLVAIGLPWLSANKDRIGSVEIASLAKLTLQPAVSAQIQNAVSSARRQRQKSAPASTSRSTSRFARDFTTTRAIQRDFEAAAILPGGSRARSSAAVAAQPRGVRP
ncbi:MAG: hypothetical protein RML45_02865 [Acetobacteraceae bacterium]|nr:hypothetical protein [Acetobacteraceae bacterium]